MVFNDVLNLLQQDLEEINLLEIYINCIDKIIRSCNNLKEKSFDHNISYTYYSDKEKVYKEKCNNIPYYVRDELKKINIFEIRDIIKSIENKDIINNEANGIFVNILNNLMESCKRVYEYLSLSDYDQRISVYELIEYLKELLDNIKFLRNINTQMNLFNSYIEGEYELKEAEDTFLIQFHNKNMSIKEITDCIEIINSMYERLCGMFEVSTSDFLLKPIKLESGSLLEKLIGCGKVFDFLKDLLNRSIEFIYRNYTNEGKIKGESNKIDLLKQGIDITNICEEHGIDTSKAKETLEANLNALCQDIYKLTAKSNKITINDKTYDKEKEISKKVIEEARKLTIESSKEIAASSENYTEK